MEYVPGADLSAVVKRHGGLDERAISVYARGILHGLAYLHGMGIVHCDVKGQNVLVREDDMAVKLADLGCAKRVDDGSGGRGTISGTPLYMAPEVARGEEQGPAADIWALGCTVIEMATGCSPWGDVQDPVAAIHRIAFSTDAPDFPCNTSDVARDFLGRCLSRDPRKRWSAEQLLNHSFVKFSEEIPSDCLPERKRNSPKSTLDQVFWDSWPEEDGEEDGAGEFLESQRVDSVRERLRQLFDGGASPRQAGANPEWEDSSWITIRNSENLRNASWEQQDEPSTSDGPWSVEPAVLAGDSGGTVVSVESYPPSQPSVLPFALADANASDSSSSVAVVSDVGYDLVLETQNFIDQATRLQTLCAIMSKIPVIFACYTELRAIMVFLS
ncbi:hypothetical protein Taro_036826 [Colocasia esculenta]|uniref:Protein kinase domain-containing protein n=1 Tax=Colocasia esculenta TaxID=4460 RepID=A0A843W9G8_COLES|nr:hypothetical protein [Colocasia esculenta]